MLSYYLSIGMPSQEYWEGDPWLVREYRKAYSLRNEQRNQEMWLQGLYNYKAFEVVMSAFSWGLGGKKGARPEPYIDHPLPITEREREAERQRSIEKTLAWAKAGQAEIERP